jgi:hypothetical protein
MDYILYTLSFSATFSLLYFLSRELLMGELFGAFFAEYPTRQCFFLKIIVAWMCLSHDRMFDG